jgi:hypothetical protein
MYFYIPVFASEPSFTGFRSVRRDASMPVPDAQHPPADPDIDRGDPCPEDEEFFDGALTTFGCVEWQSQLFRGVMRARCYPFNLPKKRFHSFNPQVGCTLISLRHHLVHTQYMTVRTTYILSMYQYIPCMMLLCCSCAGYCAGCSPLPLLH